MFSTLFALSFLPASAQTFVTDVGEPIITADEFGCSPSTNCDPFSAGWPRTLWYEDTSGACAPLPERTAYQTQHNLDTDCTGWKLLYASGGNYKMVHLPDDFTVSEVRDFQYHEIAPNDELRDHAFVRCPSGNYLHTASANLDEPNDSAYAFRYDNDLQPLSDGPIEERAPERAHNDMPLACSPLGHLTAFGNSASDEGEDCNNSDGTEEANENCDINVHSRYFWLGEGGTTIKTKDLVDMPRTAGCTFHWDPDSQGLLILEMDRSENLVISRLDADLNLREFHVVPVLPEANRGGWPQGFLRIGDYYMVALVNQETPDQFQGLVGEIWVVVLDKDWNLMEAQAVTDFDPLVGGAMTPYLSRRGETVLLSYDWNVHPGLQRLTLDLDAFGIEEGDTGGYWDTGTLFDDTGDSPDDTEDPEDTESPEDSATDTADVTVPVVDGVSPVKVRCGGCGALPTPLGTFLWLSGLALVAVRRRDS